MTDNVKRIIKREIDTAFKTAEVMRNRFNKELTALMQEADAYEEYAALLNTLLYKQAPTVAIQNLIGQLSIVTNQPLPDTPEKAGYLMSTAVKDAVTAVLLDGISSTEVLLAIVRQKKENELATDRPFEIRIQCDTPAQVERVANLLREAGLMDHDWRQNQQQ